MKRRRKVKPPAVRAVVIVVAQGIADNTVARFVHWTKKSMRKVQAPVVVCKGDPKAERFYKTRLLNEAVYAAAHKYDVIIQTDIDLVVPPGLIDATVSDALRYPNNLIHHVLRYIDPKELDGKPYNGFPWDRWVKQPFTQCSGCWNGGTPAAWLRTRGWNTEMHGWGAEDTEFWNRSRKLGVHWRTLTSFPLMHVNHPRRTPRRGRENQQIGKQYSAKSNWFTGRIIEVGK